MIDGNGKMIMMISGTYMDDNDAMVSTTIIYDNDENDKINSCHDNDNKNGNDNNDCDSCHEDNNHDTVLLMQLCSLQVVYTAPAYYDMALWAHSCCCRRQSLDTGVC